MMTKTIRCGLGALVMCAAARVSAEESKNFSLTVDSDSAPSVVDFGPQCEGGYATFEVTDFAATTTLVLRVSYACHPDGLGDKGDFWRETAARYLGDDVDLPIWPANIDRFELYPIRGKGVYRAPLLQGLVRYARFKLEGAGSVKIRNFRLDNDKVHSSGERAGEFHCSDAGLEGIWEASVRTCELSAIPSYLATNVSPVVQTLPYLADGAKRDRLVWSGDLWWAERSMFVGFNSAEPYMKGSIRLLAANRTLDGYVQACPWPEQPKPLIGDHGPFPSDEFAAWFIPVLWDYHLYRDDLPLLKETWPVVRDLVDYLQRHLRKDGIFEQRPETSKHAAGLVFGGTSCHHRAYMNLVLWLTYTDAWKVAWELGEKECAQRWRADADHLASAVRNRFWDKEKGHFVLSEEERKFGFEANALALASGFATTNEAARIMPQLVRIGHGKFQALAVRGKFMYGDPKGALAAIDAHGWRGVLAADWPGAHLTSECMHKIRKGWGDEAHPDTALAGALVNHVVGVEPLEPGYRKFRFKPPTACGLTFASAVIPTPHGEISASWRLRDDGTVEEKLDCPSGTTRVVDPPAPAAVDTDTFEPKVTGELSDKQWRVLAYVKGKPSGAKCPNDILVSDPDYVVYVPDQPFSYENPDPKRRGDSYNDHFQVIRDESNGLFYAFWTQATKECAPDQHICFSKSADNGKTWSYPAILAGGETRQYPRLVASWQQPMLAKTGRLYCLWNQQTTSEGPSEGAMAGIFSDDQGESWSAPKIVPFGSRTDMDVPDVTRPPTWCNWQRPLRLGENGRFFVGCSREGKAPGDAEWCNKIDFWQYENIDENPKIEDIRITSLNPNERALSVEKIREDPTLPRYRWTLGSLSCNTVAEAAVVKLPDGRLFALMRSSVGYPLWSVSADGGRNWSALKFLRDRTGKVLLHPCSPCPLYDWKGCEAASGFYFALVHDTFDFDGKNMYQTRGPLYLLVGRFNPDAEQPIEFAPKKLFNPRHNGNACYSSYTVVDGEGVLWYPDRKYYLLGRRIGKEWFE